jgi:hypothetical protein
MMPKLSYKNRSSTKRDLDDEFRDTLNGCGATSPGACLGQLMVLVEPNAAERMMLDNRQNTNAVVIYQQLRFQGEKKNSAAAKIPA